MAKKAPALVVDSTSQNGTGTYTLSDPVSPGAGTRTLADAVAAGFVANGDLVGYIVVDTTKQGATLQFERGIGTVGGGGTTLARTNIRENHLGTTAAVSWPSGGSRTVRISLSPDDVAQLDAAQTFTALQTFSAGLTATENSRVKKTGAVGAFDVGSSLATTSNTLGRFGILGHSSTGVERVAAQWQAIWTDATNASEDALLRAVVMVAGTGTVVAQIDSAGMKDGSGNAYGLANQLSAPSGTKIPFGSSPPPAGWTQDTTSTDAALRVVSGALGSPGGTRGLSSSTVGGTVLDISQVPSHTHGPGAGTSFHMRNAGSGDSYATSPGNLFVSAAATAAAGGGGSHDHALALKYVDVLMATKI